MLLFVFSCPTVLAQESVTTIYEPFTIAGCRYWIDKDTMATQASHVGGKFQIDTSPFKEGFHTLHYEVLDSKGGVSPARMTTFFIPERGIETIYENYAPAKMRYWFDKDYTTATEITYANGTTAINITALASGFHTLHYQVIDNHGKTTPVRFSTFFIPERSVETVYEDYTPKTMRYWFDRDYTSATETDYASGATPISVTALAAGFHTLHYLVIDNHGATTPVRFTSFFIPERSIASISKDYTTQTFRYWFDEDTTAIHTDVFLPGPQILDLSNLSEGVHTMYYQVVTAEGEASPTHTVTVDRWLYDIYISRYTEYADSTVNNNPLFATRPDLKLHFLPDDINTRGHLTVNEGTTLSLGKFIQTANWGYKNDGSKYTKAGTEYYHPTTLLNNGHVRADSVMVKQNFYRDRWHFLSLPFNVRYGDIDVPEGTYWALRSYDGEARAAGLMTDTWQNLRKGDLMQAGKGYILQLTKEGSDQTSWLIFKASNDPQKNNIFTTADVATTLEEHPAEFAHNRSWNLVGNPYPAFFDTRCLSQDGNIIVWNGNGYTAYFLTDDSYVLMPFEAFFIQKPVNVDALTFGKEGRQHTYEVLPRAESRRRLANGQQDRHVLNFMLSDGIDTDRSRVVICEQALTEYETGKDAPKFMEVRPQMPQLFSVESGVQYAINERPKGDGQIVFSLYAPAAGEYRFSVEGEAGNMMVLDTETGSIWSLNNGDYVFTALEGMHNARLIVSLTGEATAIAQINTYDDGEIKVSDELLTFRFMRNKQVRVYSLDGRILFNQAVRQANVKVSRGVYLVDIDGKITKIMVK